MGVRINTLRTWVRGRKNPATGEFSAPIIALPNPDSPELSFVNLTEVHVLKILRKSHNVPLNRIRSSLDYLSEEYGQPHPLADIDFLTNNLDLFIEVMDDLVNASRGGQVVMKQMVIDYLHRIDRDEAGKAARLFPLQPGQHTDDDARVVVIDPAVCFGRPLLFGTRTPTDVIYDRYRAGDSTASMAEEYQRSVHDIEKAIAWETAAYDAAA